MIERHGDKVGRDTDRIEKTIMMGTVLRSAEAARGCDHATLGAMSGTDPEQARKQMMIGSRDECLETIDRYIKVGVTHFIFTMTAPFFMDEVQRFARRSDSRSARELTRG